MNPKIHRLLLGAHMSIAGGLVQALERGHSIGCTTIQLFTKSNRQWGAKPLNSVETQEFKEAAKIFNIAPVIAHATYLINLGSPDITIQKKSIDAVIMELDRCAELDIPYFVLHPGSCLQTNENDCLQRIAQNLDIALSQTTSKTLVLLETMAGQGSVMCYSFEHIAHILHQSQYKQRLGVCFDTCHVFAAGYDFRTIQTYNAMWENFDKIIGLRQLKVIHVNESKKTLGSRVDRHAHIGEGNIGLEAFRLLFNDPRFFDIPKILETPKDSLEDDMRNINAIKQLISPKTKKLLYIED
ncbi:MAG TPA: deoxyribonuclease IV [Candidatus Dependentiae bacterium]|nr:deoxyribonuclease IV [Candidatus Dependentiae bacterium]HRQ62981.1 deoxyribonuclease IV [Candidatus Dependentiae bacterium]